MNDVGATDTPQGASQPLEVRGATAVVTGAAGGIGIALVRELARRGATTIVAADLDDSHTRAVAEAIDGEFGSCSIVGVGLDVADRRATEELVESVEAEQGAIDLWCANAGIGTLEGIESDPATWQRVWEVNLMAHVHAAAVLVPRWIRRGHGHLLVTASAAGLLTNLGDAPYSTTKHAAVAFAEWVAVTHGDQGVGVTCLCPQGVRTPMVFGAEADEFAALRPGSVGASPEGSTAAVEAGQADADDLDRDGAMAIAAVRSLEVLEPREVAAVALDALEAGRFLALPHPEVAAYEQARAADHDRWIAGMRRLQRALSGE